MRESGGVAVLMGSRVEGLLDPGFLCIIYSERPLQERRYSTVGVTFPAL